MLIVNFGFKTKFLRIFEDGQGNSMVEGSNITSLDDKIGDFAKPFITLSAKTSIKADFDKWIFVKLVHMGILPPLYY